MKIVVWNDREGRRTLAVLWEDKRRYVGIALRGKKDQFCRWKGRKVAEGRARFLRAVICGDKSPRSSLHAFDFYTDQADMKVVESYKIPDWMWKEALPKEDHACSTGDCPHEKQSECDAELEKEYGNSTPSGS